MPPERPALGRPAVLALAGLCALALVGHTVLLPLLPPVWRLAGSAPLYLVGVAGALLLALPAVFALAKRNGASPRPWFVAHVLAGAAGLVLVVVHAAGHWGRPPVLLLLLALVLLLQGMRARIKVADKLAGVMASRPRTFEGAPERVALAELLERKRKLLASLDPAAEEAIFSPGPGHWLRHPGLTLAYQRLVRAEAGLLGARRAAGLELSRWRQLHMIAGWLLFAGLIVHVVTVTFFAGYVADGGDVHWWHVAAWGA
ncbi:MAG TPA: hypothetical protein QGF63_18540 [Alphaproteobacteria bacterium]|jgi:hypothetical protein|nr:hypothetical protein [Alphaproteobacteria bacterium]MDP6271499.1 hypothetical protein [Alphaproteobacteria bacterium]MDP7426940.1 hypothetical protein [Alphaproteobacteria bacterium]HJM51825.1 hypothetical protein [Alphaproteobacteria bacterium]